MLCHVDERWGKKKIIAVMTATRILATTPVKFEFPSLTHTHTALLHAHWLLQISRDVVIPLQPTLLQIRGCCSSFFHRVSPSLEQREDILYPLCGLLNPWQAVLPAAAGVCFVKRGKKKRRGGRRRCRKRSEHCRPVPLSKQHTSR